MIKNKNSKELLQKPEITKDLQIRNYNTLVNDAKLIQKKYINFTNNHDNKQIRNLKTKLNRLSRSLNDLRKEKSKPYRKNLKIFKANIDNLRNIIGVVTNKLNQPLKATKEYKLEKQTSKDQLLVNNICNRYNVPSIQISHNTFKRTLSKAKKIAIIVQAAKAKAKYQALQSAKIFNGKAIEVDVNGEIRKSLGIAKRLTFMGSPEKLDELLSFAKVHHIVLKEH